jgi:hypothetical protein
MALNLTGKLSEVFERIGVDIADIFSKLNTNTNKVAELNTQVTDYQQDLVDYRRTINDISRRSLPYTNFDGAVLVSRLIDDEIVYVWQSLSSVPMDVVDAPPRYYPKVTIQNSTTSTYNIKTGQLIYTGGTVPLGPTDASGNVTEIPGAYTTLKLSDNPSERAFYIVAYPTLYWPTDSFNFTIIFSTSASPTEAYHNENLQSIKLTLTPTEQGNVFTYRAINQDADGGVINGVTEYNDILDFNYGVLYINSEYGTIGTRDVQTSDYVQYMHFIVTKETGTYETNDINTMKLTRVLEQN